MACSAASGSRLRTRPDEGLRAVARFPHVLEVLLHSRATSSSEARPAASRAETLSMYARTLDPAAA
ncbi:hypothetical protein [Streptomyces sp. NPDC053560]|uniref:hypothetical protein n=1 Tax=Streptomyces sp. NPDC053560 TaxID=3365711 RepID=UPI0037D91131